MSWIGVSIGRAATSKIYQLRLWWRRSVFDAVLLVFCALLAIVGISVITVGSYVSLSSVYTPWIAGVIVGGVILVMSALGGLATWHVTRPLHSPPGPGNSQRNAMDYRSGSESDGEAREHASGESPASHSQIDAVTHIGERIGESLNNGRIKTTDVVLAALVAGTVLGASPALRQRILQRKSRVDKERAVKS